MHNSAFATDDRGNVAIMFAACLMVLIGVAGLAVDYAVGVHRKRSLDTALDASILAGTQAAADARASGKPDWSKIGVNAATAMYTANLPDGGNYESQSFASSFEVQGAEMVGKANYTGRSRTSFMQVFGKDDLRFSGGATAKLSAANYVDVSFVIDNSMSMGIGATAAAQSQMQSAKKCALACHYKDIYNTPTVTPADAKAMGVTLRIDIVRDGVKAAIRDLRSKVTGPGQSGRLRVGLYTFANGLKTLAAPNTDIDAVLAAADQIGLDSSDYGGGTFIGLSLRALTAQLPKGGTGTSVSDRLSFVVLFSDGIEDSARMFKVAPRNGGTYDINSTVKTSGVGQNWWSTNPVAYPVNTWMQAFDPAVCSGLKAQSTGNHLLLAIRVRYLVAAGLGTNNAVKFIVDKLPAALETSFQSCVSKPEYYKTAGTTEEIAPAFDYIANQIVSAKGVALAH